MKKVIKNKNFIPYEITERTEDDNDMEELLAELVKYLHGIKDEPRPDKVIRKMIQKLPVRELLRYCDSEEMYTVMDDFVTELVNNIVTLQPEEIPLLLEGSKFSRGVSLKNGEYLGSFFSFTCIDGSDEEGTIIANTVSDYWFILKDDIIVITPYQNERLKKIIDDYVRLNVLNKNAA